VTKKSAQSFLNCAGYNGVVIACDKREAFAQGSDSDEAIHLSFMPRVGLLRFGRND
jgi:hypothetical protein